MLQRFFSKLSGIKRGYLAINKERRHSILVTLCLIVLFAVLGVLFELLYLSSASRELDVKGFVEKLHERERYTMRMLQNVRNDVENKGVTSLFQNQVYYDESSDNDISIMVYEKNELVYWSNNCVDIQSVESFPFKRVFFHEAGNCFAEVLQIFTDEYRYVAFIKIRENVYPSHRRADNKFARGFTLPSSVQFMPKGAPDSVEISTYDGNYLFSLRTQSVYNPSRTIYWFCLVSWILCFLFVLILCLQVYFLFRNGVVGWLFLFGTVVFFSVIVLLLSSVRIPDIIFSHDIFSPVYYASSLASSVGHLYIYTILAFCFYFVFRKYKFSFSLNGAANRKKYVVTILLSLLCSLFYWYIYYLAVDVIDNSSIDVAITQMQDVTGFTISALLLILSWFILFVLFSNVISSLYIPYNEVKIIVISKGIAVLACFLYMIIAIRNPDYFAFVYFAVISFLIDISRCYYRHKSFLIVSILAFLLINMVVSVCYFHCEIRNRIKYQTVAENLASGQVMQQDYTAECLLKDMSPLIRSDINLRRMVMKGEGNSAAVDSFLHERYFNGFWNKYDIMAQVVKMDDFFDVNKSNYGKPIRLSPKFVKEKGLQLGASDFYLNTDETLALNYIGAIRFSDKVLYIKFYPNTSYNRISFLEQTMQKQSSNLVNISTVKYHENELLYLSGDYHYPNVSTWIPNVRRQFFQFHSNGYVHFVARFGIDGLVVVSKPEQQSYSYIIFVSYFFAMYLFIALFVICCSTLLKRQGKIGNSLLSRMQLWFLMPMMLSSIVLGGLTLSFFLSQFKKKQISELSFRAASIQQNIQYKLDVSEDLSEIDDKKLEQWLEELSNLFYTDIILYDKAGVQASSSRVMYMSEKTNVASLISPKPMFSMQTEYYQDEKKGGRDYLSFYTRLYNKRNQHLGYLNVLSSSGAVQIRNDVSSLLIIIIDVYMVVILLSILAIWLINKKMTNPLALISKKFTEIKLKGENPKIEYGYDDEIGQLVTQYNAMVDKLHDSAEKLAQSERESAWRDMARRIAHEIKNPLTPMKLSVQQAVRKKEIDPENFDEYFIKSSKVLIEQIDNLSRIASEFSNFAKTTVMVQEEVDIAEKLQSVVSLFENNSEGVVFSLDMHGNKSAVILGDNKQILQVFNNLFKNAIQAIPEDKDGRVEVDFSVKDGLVTIRISDNGCGIPSEIRENLFLPNFTTKTSGMGLGLAIVKNIVRCSKGEIWFESVEGEGTTFVVEIPLA